jgi:hypothetical protein
MTGCSSDSKVTPTQVYEKIPSTSTQKAKLENPNSIHTASPIPIPYPAPTSLLTEPSAYPYPPIENTPLPQFSDTPLVPTIAVPVVKPSKPMKKTSIESILEWMKYGMGKPDIAVFDILATNEINYGPYQSESTGFYTKEQFLKEISLRLPSQPKCVTYYYRTGEITVLYITTAGWNPEWDFGGLLVSNCVVFDFRDQGTKEEGLYLMGVYTTPCLEWQFQGTPFP